MIQLNKSYQENIFFGKLKVLEDKVFLSNFFPPYVSIIVYFFIFIYNVLFRLEYYISLYQIFDVKVFRFVERKAWPQNSLA